MMPWKLYADAAAYIFTWLIGYSSLMGAIGGILIADYWVLRRQRAVAAPICSTLQRPLRATRTASTGARSRRWCSPSCRCVPGLRARGARRRADRSPNPTFLDTLYTYAWFVTFGLSFAIYLLLMRGRMDARR